MIELMDIALQRRQFSIAARLQDIVNLKVIEHKGDFIYRYCVRLADGETATFFEFELTLL